MDKNILKEYCDELKELALFSVSDLLAFESKLAEINPATNFAAFELQQVLVRTNLDRALGILGKINLRNHYIDFANYERQQQTLGDMHEKSIKNIDKFFRDNVGYADDGTVTIENPNGLHSHTIVQIINSLKVKMFEDQAKIIYRDFRIKKIIVNGELSFHNFYGQIWPDYLEVNGTIIVTKYNGFPPEALASLKRKGVIKDFKFE